MRMKTFRITTALILILSLFVATAAYAAGDIVYTNTRLLADNLEYTNTIAWDSEDGRTESFAIRMTGAGDAYPIVMKGDTIYGGFKISNMVNYAESQGKNVLAVLNTDFFADNAVPIGIVIEDGVYKSSANGRNAVTFGYDGSVNIIEAPDVRISLLNYGNAEDGFYKGGEDDITADPDDADNSFPDDDINADSGYDGNAGKRISLTNFNKVRADFGGMCMYSEAFSTVSTRTTSPGWFIRFKILDGTPSVSGEMVLEVTEMIESDTAVPIGEGYMVLTAAEQSELTEEFEKFSVGDIVTLTTSCTDERLADAQYATGGGDILVRGGVKTDMDGWSPAVTKQKAPRTAFGITADGIAVCYIIDGRNSEHSVGMTMDELADEMLRQGCVYAVNFDGGGSTALSVRFPGDDRASVVSRPSDGLERSCATYLLFVTDAIPGGDATNLSLRNDGVIVLAESSVDLEITATDGGLMPTAVPEDITAAAMDPSASVSEMQYTAGDMAGTDRISLYSPSTGAYGMGEVYVITRPTSISANIKGVSAPLTSIRIAPGMMLELDVTATYYRRAVVAQAHSFTYEVSGDIGEMIEPGVFMAGMMMSQTGTITISAGGRSIDIQVEISGFTDMENHWAREYAEYLLQTGVSKGITDTEYGPSLLMKRCDFILMLYRVIGEPETTVFSAFDDVPPDLYYTHALIWAKKAGIAEGDEDNNFYPQMPLTRQDAFTFTYRALSILNKEYVEGTAEDLADFPDAELVDDYAVIPTATLISLGIVEGMDGILSPESTLTRAQMAKVLTFVLQLPIVEEEALHE